MKRFEPAWVVILAGVSAALHVGKLPPALPALREALAISLVQAGFLLSLVQFAGMTLGLAAGLAADAWGLRRSMLCGLLLLGCASVLGGWAQDAPTLLALRAVEGAGLLLATMPAPSLIRQLVPPARLNVSLGLWGAYMPLGTASALLAAPWVIQAAGWQGWWWVLGGIALVMAAWLWWAVPPDHRRLADGAPAGVQADAARSWAQRLHLTLTSRGPWLVALSFAVYSGQWLAVIGFLPLLYSQAGLAAGWTGVLTALAAAVNMVGNIASGRLLQHGVNPGRLLEAGFTAMGLGSLAAFVALPGGGAAMPFEWRYAAVLVFSMLGGMVPGTLFSMAVQLARSPRAVSTTVGWVQQCSSVGQFAGPPLVAWLATHLGTWQWTWCFTGACALAGVGLAHGIDRERPRSPPNH